MPVKALVFETSASTNSATWAFFIVEIGRANLILVLESLDNAISFFEEIGLKLEGRAMVEGEWAGQVTGLGNQSVEIAMMVTPDGHSRIELSQFLTPAVVSD